MNWPNQVTFFAKSSDGEYSKSTFKNVDHALHGWLTLIQNEDHTFQIITPNEFKMKSAKLKLRHRACPLLLKDSHEYVGYFTVYK